MHQSFVTSKIILKLIRKKKEKKCIVSLQFQRIRQGLALKDKKIYSHKVLLEDILFISTPEICKPWVHYKKPHKNFIPKHPIFDKKWDLMLTA